MQEFISIVERSESMETRNLLHISITFTVCYKSFLQFLGGSPLKRPDREEDERIFPHFHVFKEKRRKKFHENDMLLWLAKANLQHGKRAKQQILHDVAKMILQGLNQAILL